MFNQFFEVFFGCQNDTLNSESQDMVLPCIEVKRFVGKHVFLHVAIATDGYYIGRHNFLA